MSTNKEYAKAYQESHKEQLKEHKKLWREQHKEHIKEYMKAYQESHKEHIKEYMKAYQESHKEHIKEYRALYESESRNVNGVRLGYIRTKSQRILKKCHNKIKGYEIHHCFGYTEADKFIYIPKSLHLKIHALLRELNIDSKTNHWKYISELVNNCQQYTYIMLH